MGIFKLGNVCEHHKCTACTFALCFRTLVGGWSSLKLTLTSCLNRWVRATHQVTWTFLFNVGTLVFHCIAPKAEQKLLIRVHACILICQRSQQLSDGLDNVGLQCPCEATLRLRCSCLGYQAMVGSRLGRFYANKGSETTLVDKLLL